MEYADMVKIHTNGTGGKELRKTFSCHMGFRCMGFFSLPLHFHLVLRPHSFTPDSGAWQR